MEWTGKKPCLKKETCQEWTIVPKPLHDKTILNGFE